MAVVEGRTKPSPTIFSLLQFAAKIVCSGIWRVARKFKLGFVSRIIRRPLPDADGVEPRFRLCLFDAGLQEQRAFRITAICDQDACVRLALIRHADHYGQNTFAKGSLEITSISIGRTKCP